MRFTVYGMLAAGIFLLLYAAAHSAELPKDRPWVLVIEQKGVPFKQIVWGYSERTGCEVDAKAERSLDRLPAGSRLYCEKVSK